MRFYFHKNTVKMVFLLVLAVVLFAAAYIFLAYFEAPQRG